MLVATANEAIARDLGYFPGIALGVWMVFGFVRLVTKGGTSRKDIP